MESHTNSRLRKSPTSSVVDGPPIFMNTMAVGPFEPIAFCVTGGTTVAWFLVHCADHIRGEVAGEGTEARLQSCVMGLRRAMVWLGSCGGGMEEGFRWSLRKGGTQIRFCSGEWGERRRIQGCWSELGRPNRANDDGRDWMTATKIENPQTLEFSQIT